MAFVFVAQKSVNSVAGRAVSCMRIKECADCKISAEKKS